MLAGIALPASAAGCSPDDSAAVRGDFTAGAALREQGRDPRLVEMHEAVLAGESASLGADLKVFAEEAAFDSQGALVFKGVRFEVDVGPPGCRNCAKVREIIDMREVRLLAGEDGLGMLLSPARDAPWQSVATVLEAVDHSLVKSIGFHPQ